MAWIESVVIHEFWGNHSVDLRFKPDVNFLIGRNGSGKTTAIDIIASSLQIDGEALERLPFKKIEITLYDAQKRRKPKVTVEKSDGQNLGGEISYKVQDYATASADDIRVYLPFLSRGFQTIRDSRGRYIRVPVAEKEVGGLGSLKRDLSSLISTNWLSINRISPGRYSSDRPINEAMVDRKAREVSERLERYFSELSSKANLITRNFQRKFFRSLIQIDSDFKLGKSLYDLNLDEESKSLATIFEKFSVPQEEYEKDLSGFYAHLKNIQNNKSAGMFDLHDVIPMINAHKIHSLVEQWNEVVANEKKVLLPRDAFVKILDGMLHRKYAQVLPSGEMIFETSSGKELRILDLSSGEKQLYIILGEALLQRDAEWTYLADEPELSLHVDWQEVLVDNLRALNPNGQVIFATHSPDIVSHYSDNIISMEKAIR